MTQLAASKINCSGPTHYAKHIRPGAFEQWMARARSQTLREFTGKERSAMFELYSSCYTVAEALQELPFYLD